MMMTAPYIAPALKVERIATPMGRFYRIPGQPNPMPSVTTVLHGGASNVPAHVRKAGREGGEVHGLVEQLLYSFLRGYTTQRLGLATQPERVLRIFDHFLAWWLQQRWTAVAIEYPVYSVSMQVAGTLDVAVLTAEGELCLPDWKTSTEVTNDHKKQLATYRACWCEMGNTPPSNLKLVHLREDGPPILVPVDNPADLVDSFEARIPKFNEARAAYESQNGALFK